MEADAILYQIRQQGFVIQAAGNDILLSPKSLLTEHMIHFIKQHKESILTALYQEKDEEITKHIARKASLRQGRLVILRNLIKQCYGDDWVYDTAHWAEVEEITDRALKDYDYDLEQVINNYRKIAPPFKVHDPRCKCGYMPPFHRADCTNRT